MVVLDFFIVNVALPAVATDLRAGEGALEWIVAGYGLAFAAVLIPAGRLGDRLGRRRVYAVGLALFTAASAACGLAPDPATLVAARVMQGLAGGIVMPQVLSIVNVTYRGADNARALSIYGLALGLAAIGGQVVGGALVELDLAGLDWRACFLLNVPIGVVALALTARLVPESRAPSHARLDLPGAGLLAVGLVAVLLPLIEGRQHGWPLWTWLSFAVAVDAFALFVLHQRRVTRRGGDALLDLALFRERSFSAGLLAQFLLASAQASFFVYFALYLQQGRGLAPLEAGLVFSILALAYVAVSGPAPQLVARFGRAVVAAGGLALAGGLGLLALATAEVGVGGSLLVLGPGMLLVGAGIGLCYTPLNATVLSQVRPEAAGAASGVMSATAQVGYALGIAVTGLLFFAEADADMAHAFEVSLLQMGVLGLGIVAATCLLPSRTGAAAPPEAATVSA